MAKQNIGATAFLIGIVLCIVLAFVAWIAPTIVQEAAWLITLVLIVLGVIIGVFNINEKQRMDLIISVLVVSSIGPITIQQISALVPVISVLIEALFQYTIALTIPAALIIGLKQIWAIGMGRK